MTDIPTGASSVRAAPSGLQLAALQIAHAEAAGGGIAARDLLIVTLRETHDEQLIVELIRPEPGHPVMDEWPVQHVERRGLGLFKRIVDRFQAHPHFESQ